MRVLLDHGSVVIVDLGEQNAFWVKLIANNQHIEVVVIPNVVHDHSALVGVTEQLQVHFLEG